MIQELVFKALIYYLEYEAPSIRKENIQVFELSIDWIKKLHLVTHLRENQQCFPNTYYVLHFILLLCPPKEGERRGPSRGPITVPLSDGAWIRRGLCSSASVEDPRDELWRPAPWAPLPAAWVQAVAQNWFSGRSPTSSCQAGVVWR